MSGEKPSENGCIECAYDNAVHAQERLFEQMYNEPSIVKSVVEKLKRLLHLSN